MDEDKARRVKELEDKIHKLRMEKLLNIEYITEKMKNGEEKFVEINEALDEARESLEDCSPEDIKRYKVVIKALEAKIKVLSSQTQALNKLRLLHKNLLIEESKLYVLKRDEE